MIWFVRPILIANFCANCNTYTSTKMSYFMQLMNSTEKNRTRFVLHTRKVYIFFFLYRAKWNFVAAHVNFTIVLLEGVLKTVFACKVAINLNYFNDTDDLDSGNWTHFQQQLKQIANERRGILCVDQIRYTILQITWFSFINDTKPNEMNAEQWKIW